MEGLIQELEILTKGVSENYKRETCENTSVTIETEEGHNLTINKEDEKEVREFAISLLKEKKIPSKKDAEKLFSSMNKGIIRILKLLIDLYPFKDKSQETTIRGIIDSKLDQTGEQIKSH